MAQTGKKYAEFTIIEKPHLTAQEKKAFRELINKTISSGGAVGFDHTLTLHEANAFFRKISAKKNHYVLVKEKSKLVGFGYLDALGGLSSHIGEMHKIIVDPDFRNRGIGTKIITLLIDKAKSLGLYSIIIDVRANQKKTITWYKKHGFSTVGKLKAYIKSNGTLWDNYFLQLMLNTKKVVK